jgi:hypothetical protein
MKNRNNLRKTHPNPLKPGGTRQTDQNLTTHLNSKNYNFMLFYIVGRKLGKNRVNFKIIEIHLLILWKKVMLIIFSIFRFLLNFFENLYIF